MSKKKKRWAYCPRCGWRNEQYYSYCAKCKRPLNKPKEPKNPKPIIPKRIIIGLSLAIVLLVALYFIAPNSFKLNETQENALASQGQQTGSASSSIFGGLFEKKPEYHCTDNACINSFDITKPEDCTGKIIYWDTQNLDYKIEISNNSNACTIRLEIIRSTNSRLLGKYMSCTLPFDKFSALEGTSNQTNLWNQPSILKYCEGSLKDMAENPSSWFS